MEGASSFDSGGPCKHNRGAVSSLGSFEPCAWRMNVRRIPSAPPNSPASNTTLSTTVVLSGVTSLPTAKFLISIAFFTMKMFALVPVRPLSVSPCGSWHASQLYANAYAAGSWLIPEKSVFPSVLTRSWLARGLAVVAWHAAQSPLTVPPVLPEFPGTVAVRRFPW